MHIMKNSKIKSNTKTYIIFRKTKHADNFKSLRYSLFHSILSLLMLLLLSKAINERNTIAIIFDSFAMMFNLCFAIYHLSRYQR